MQSVALYIRRIPLIMSWRRWVTVRLSSHDLRMGLNTNITRFETIGCLVGVSTDTRDVTWRIMRDAGVDPNDISNANELNCSGNPPLRSLPFQL